MCDRKEDEGSWARTKRGILGLLLSLRKYIKGC